MNSNDIKALSPVVCPHCNKDVIVELITSAPKITDVFTVEDVDKAKKEVVKQIRELNIGDEVKEPAILWVNNPDTLFSPNDIPEIIKNLKKQDPTDESEETPEEA